MKKIKLIGFVFLICSFPLFSQHISKSPPGYAVASAHPLATQAGLDVLRKGGNAFDAAIAVSSVLGVVAPYHSGFGGGGYWLLYDAKNQKNWFIDGREVAPLAAKKDMFLDQDGHVIPGLSINGGLAAAIPGQPAILAYVAAHFARLSLNKNLQYAINLAEKGFIIDHQFDHFIHMGDRLKQLKRFSAAAKIFFKKGQPYKVGERLVQPDLAKTLKIYAQKGHDGFYQGDVANKLVRAVNKAGGIWTLEDLKKYRVKIKEPLQGAYKNMLVVTVPPSSAGGVSLLTMLNILSNFQLKEFTRVEWIHNVTEAMRLAFWQRSQYLGDPDFVSIPLKRLLSAENAKSLASYIKPNKATPSSNLPKMPEPKTSQMNTTHFSIIDKEGNRVSATETVNFIFGSSVVAEGTGILLNDEMDDFSSKTGASNVFGIVGSEANSIAPGKRPLSNMAPTFLLMPGRLAILGTPGGSRIPTMVLLASLAFQDYFGAITLVSSMRFHHQYLPDVLKFEPETFSPYVQKKLKEMGYQLVALQQYYGDMQAITWDQKHNILTATSDPRHIGLAVAVTQQENGYGVNH